MHDRIVSKIKKLLSSSVSKKLPGEIKVVFLSPREARKLNFIYRGKSKPANVLSFFYSSEYGEILICQEIVKKEAKEQGNSQDFQMTWMIAHGILHLAGVHHDEGSRVQAYRFFEFEKKILAKFFKKARNHNLGSGV